MKCTSDQGTAQRANVFGAAVEWLESVTASLIDALANQALSGAFAATSRRGNIPVVIHRPYSPCCSVPPMVFHLEVPAVMCV